MADFEWRAALQRAMIATGQCRMAVFESTGMSPHAHVGVRAQSAKRSDS
jgi:hypothetical protein